MANDVKPDDVKRPAPGPKPAGRGAEAAAPPPGRMVGAWITVILLAGLLASLWLNGASVSCGTTTVSFSMHASARLTVASISSTLKGLVM